MGLYEYWRDVSTGSPFDSITRYRVESDDDTYVSDTFNVPTGNLGPVHPPVGTVILNVCDGLTRKQYKGIGNSSGLNIVSTPNDPSCCDMDLGAFQVNRTNNTDQITPNGTIVVTGVSPADINDYEASIDGGGSWVSPVADAITFSGLAANNYSVIVRLAGSPCTATVPITITNQFTYPPLGAEEQTLPDLYSPVFRPITIGFKLTNNNTIVKSDVDGTYLEALTTDAAEYLANGGPGGGFPIIKIIDNDDYGGKYQILSRSTPGDPPDVGTKFYIDATYTTDQAVYFVPFERQVFYLYAEKSFNVYQKIAEIAVYPDPLSTFGEYKLRVEGFLQSIFKPQAPVDNGAEFSLLKKYYVVPRDLDMSDPPTVLNAVYSAAPTLTPFLDELVPLGPAPINFINEQTAKGLPVIFSYIDLTAGRIVNITSSQETDITSVAPVVYVPGLPLNQYDVEWINPGGLIATPITQDPALPAWITILPSDPDRIKLHIDLSSGSGGDYSGDDYEGDDYLTGGINGIVGCYEYDFKDGDDEVLFKLRVCAFPITKSNFECSDPQSFNIAWVNREGGWSSYIFTGRQVHGTEIGDVKTFKDSGVIKRQAIEDVYDYAEATVAAVAIRDLQFIASLRKSIQAYIYNPLSLSWDIPILIDSRSFEMYEIPFEQINVSTGFSFKYAEETIIQTQ